MESRFENRFHMLPTATQDLQQRALRREGGGKREEGRWEEGGRREEGRKCEGKKRRERERRKK